MAKELLYRRKTIGHTPFWVLKSSGIWPELLQTLRLCSFFVFINQYPWLLLTLLNSHYCISRSLSTTIYYKGISLSGLTEIFWQPVLFSVRPDFGKMKHQFCKIKNLIPGRPLKLTQLKMSRWNVSQCGVLTNLRRKPLRILDDAFVDDLGTERVPSIIAKSNLHQAKKALKTAKI